MSVPIPAGVLSMAARGPQWQDWVDRLPELVRDLMAEWDLRDDGSPTHGNCSLVVPVLISGRTAAALKVGIPDDESEHEHLALRRWGGLGAVSLLSADPYRRALLLERLESTDLASIPDVEACAVVAGLYRDIHVPAMPQLRSLSTYVGGWNAELAAMPRGAPIPRRLVEQALALGRELSSDRALAERVLHTDLHYANVLAGRRQPWAVIDPKPVNGDPHYEIAPMLWNRWDEIAGDVREGVRRRFWTLVDAAGFDEDRARAWVIVRMVHIAMWAIQDDEDPSWLTRCIAVAKAVQD